MIETKQCLVCHQLRWRIDLPEEVLLTHEVKEGVLKTTSKVLVKTSTGNIKLARRVLDLRQKKAEWKWSGLDKNTDTK